MPAHGGWSARPPVLCGTIRPRRGIRRLHTCHKSLTYLINAKNSHTNATIVTLTWLIRASWLIWGSIVHQSHPEALIHPGLSRLETPWDSCISRRTGVTTGERPAGGRRINVEDSGYTAWSARASLPTATCLKRASLTLATPAPGRTA